MFPCLSCCRTRMLGPDSRPRSPAEEVPQRMPLMKVESLMNSTTSEDDRPTIVFLHGAWADATGFDGSIRALQSQGGRWPAVGVAAATGFKTRQRQSRLPGRLAVGRRQRRSEAARRKATMPSMPFEAAMTRPGGCDACPLPASRHDRAGEPAARARQ